MPCTAGVSGQFALPACQVSTAWGDLKQVVPVRAVIPFHRWDVDARLQNADGSAGGVRFGGLVRNVDRFDNAMFGVSPAEAALLDPQQRLLLAHCYEARPTRAHDAAPNPTTCASQIRLRCTYDAAMAEPKASSCPQIKATRLACTCLCGPLAILSESCHTTATDGIYPAAMVTTVTLPRHAGDGHSWRQTGRQRRMRRRRHCQRGVQRPSGAALRSPRQRLRRHWRRQQRR